MISFMKSKNYKLVAGLIALVIVLQAFFMIAGEYRNEENAQWVATVSLTIRDIEKAIRAGNLFYISPDGNDTTGDGSYGNPWATLRRALSAMEGDDTLIIKDGVYKGENNTIAPWLYPPNGSPLVGYTTIRAEHVGRAIFDGEMNRSLVYISGNGMDTQPSYLHFDGIWFRNSKGAIAEFITVNHIKITRCFFSETDNSDGNYSDSLFFRYADYVLIENSAIWGNGRYHYFILDSNHFVLRRDIDRYDRGFAVGYSNMGSFRIYSSSNTTLENCITIDGDQNAYYLQHSDSGPIPAIPKSYWPAGANGPTDNVHILGSIALNNKGMSMYILSPQWDPENNTVENSVFWDGKNGLWSRVERNESMIFDHLTVGNISTGGEYAGIRGEYGYSIVAKNSILYGIGNSSQDYALTWTDNPENSSDYNVLYNNMNNYQTNHGAHPQPHDFCEENGNPIDPLDGNPGNGVPALKYLVRIENGSDLNGTASDGGDRGATIFYRIGKDGTMWGEPGWNETTNITLWPWPYEDIIKELMSQYYYDNSSDNLPPIRGDRGFCGNGTGLYGGPITLTSYIWEYLGNPLPDYIYGTLTITTQALPEGVLGRYYITDLEAVGGIKPYTWSIESGTLPPGLQLNSTTGIISGYPNQKGNYTFTVLVEDSSNPKKNAAMSYSIEISEAQIPEFSEIGIAIIFLSLIEIINMYRRKRNK